MTGEEINATLKPCPFCGGNAELTRDRKEELLYGAEREYRVDCRKCPAIMRGTYWGSLMDMWNARVVP